MKIDLLSITIENVFSFSSEHTIDFSQEPGLKYIMGENKVEPRLGSNGSGKSSAWGALSWCLYNLTPQGQKASEIVSFGEARPHVVTTLALDGEPFIIDRVGIPNVLTINGKPAEQPDLDRLLGLSRERFMHSVLFGQAVPLFLDLSVAQRGEIMDQVMNLEQWQDRSIAAGTKVAMLEKEVVVIERTIARMEGQLASLPDEEMLRLAAGEWDDSHKTKLDEMILRVEIIERDVIREKLELDAIRRKEFELEKNAPPSTIALATEIRDKQNIIINTNRRISDCNATIRYYTDHTKCDVCQQNISNEFATAKVKEANRQKDDLMAVIDDAEHDIQKLTKKLQAGHDLAVEHDTKKRELGNQAYKLSGSIAANERNLDTAVRNAEAAAGENTNPYRAQLIQVENTRDSVSLELAAQKILMDRTKGEIAAVSYWKAGFRRVRLFIISRILASLEVEIASAVSTLGLPDWHIKLETETENKSGTMKQGIQVLVKSPTAPNAWTAWSGGEGQRIKLAVSIGFSNLIQRMAGVQFGFEVWDEPTAWLSVEGIDDLLDCLEYRASSTQKSIWLLDHRTLGYGGFSESWKVVKTMRGSRMARIS